MMSQQPKAAQRSPLSGPLSALLTAQTSKAIFIGVLTLISSYSLARGGPAPQETAVTKPAAPAQTQTKGPTGDAASQPHKSAIPTADLDDKDINPFTGQSLSEAQLRRTLEREKLITAISAEKTKQTQSNSELQTARLRNAAEKSRLSTEMVVLSPVAMPSPAPNASTRKTSKAASSLTTAAANTVRTATPASPAGAMTLSPNAAGPSQDVAPSPSRSSRAEIKFSDEIVELKAGRFTGTSVIASVDAQRQPPADANQPRSITPITVPPATLPALPSPFSSMVPAPNLP